MDVAPETLFEHVLEWPPAAGSGPAPAEGGDPSLKPKRTADPLPSSGGVYLLTDEHNRLVQLAAAADLRRTLRHRLAPREAAVSADAPGAVPTDSPAGSGQAEETGLPAGASLSKRPDLGAIVRRIWWRPANSAFELTWEYYRLARVLIPTAYLQQVAFGPAWFVYVDAAAAIPRFQVAKYLRGLPGLDFGPFGTQSDATRFVEILEEAFDLCRYYHILEQVPHGQPCAYYEMGKCPAPCSGSVSMDVYRGMIREALGFALGEREPLYEKLQAQMREAAGRREFERAAVLKQRWDRARGVEHEAYRFVRPVDEFNYLVLQSGGSRTRVKPFYVFAGAISAGEVVRLKDVAAAVEGWIQQMHAPAAPAATVDETQRSEQIWLVSKFLFKKDAPGLLLHAGDLGTAAELAERVRVHWAKPQDQVGGDSPESRNPNLNKPGNANGG